MKIIGKDFNEELDLPLQLNISFRKVYDMFEKYAKDSYETHPFHASAKNIVAHLSKTPELISGFTDLSLIEKYSEEINLLLDPLFPEALLLNEIKAASIPFTFTSFKLTDRFQNILNNAGSDFELKVRNFEEDSMYIMACTYILGFCYGIKADVKRPFYFNIPDKTTGTMKYYRAAFNADFTEISRTDKAPKLNQEDFKELLNNYDNIDLWREKFPPNSYIFKGFGIINLFDVTAEEMISSIKANLLAEEDNLIESLESNLKDFYGIKDLKLGYSLLHNAHSSAYETIIKSVDSIILNHNHEVKCDKDFFCEDIMTKVFENKETFVISDIDKYGEFSNENQLYKNLKKQNLKSIVLIPIQANSSEDLALLEISSPNAYDLNSVNINKLKDIIPVFEAAVNRVFEERQNNLEATIQENYTSIHNSVKWRFYEAAEKYYFNKASNSNAKLDEIVFKDVFPLFGQTDIKGSSEARNNAIKEDLITQLTLAISVLESACTNEPLPIYNELMFRVTGFLNNVKKGLNAGDEITIIDFLKREIYPVFRHIKEINKELFEKVGIYTKRLDKELDVVYEKRKDYEQSVNHINDKLAQHIDSRQKEAQAMFPHYFERYKTDGIEYNMYIGQSITKTKKFNPLYFHNLRIWQLKTTCELENIVYHEQKNMPFKLEVASLILVHGNAMSIKFRMDEKQFDVDGAYNIRYEIIKKRIDKANIKGTTERLTTPGKIAIVYSQEADAEEYVKYIKFLQSKNKLGKLEFLEIEDLQGISGLKALRVEVKYQEFTEENKAITYKDLLKELEV